MTELWTLRFRCGGSLDSGEVSELNDRTGRSVVIEAAVWIRCLRGVDRGKVSSRGQYSHNKM